jgi:Na+-transporting methylmalonyl-CoA/oxaloacetate decarboxylase beta subunit
VLGIIHATFAFAFVGAGLDSVVAAQQAAYRSCLAAGHADCRLTFHMRTAITPELLAALAALGLLALIPIVVKRWRARSRLTPPLS